MLKKTLKIISSVVVMLLVVVVVGVGESLLDPHIAAVPITISTDNGAKVIVFVYSFPSFAMPGQGSDRDGFVRVYNNNGLMLCQFEVPLAGQIYEQDIRWGGNSVSIPGGNGFESCQLS